MLSTIMLLTAGLVAGIALGSSRLMVEMVRLRSLAALNASSGVVAAAMAPEISTTVSGAAGVSWLRGARASSLSPFSARPGQGLRRPLSILRCFRAVPRTAIDFGKSQSHQMAPRLMVQKPRHAAAQSASDIAAQFRVRRAQGGAADGPGLFLGIFGERREQCQLLGESWSSQGSHWDRGRACSFVLVVQEICHAGIGPPPKPLRDSSAAAGAGPDAPPQQRAGYRELSGKGRPCQSAADHQNQRPPWSGWEEIGQVACRCSIDRDSWEVSRSKLASPRRLRAHHCRFRSQALPTPERASSPSPQVAVRGLKFNLNIGLRNNRPKAGLAMLRSNRDGPATVPAAGRDSRKTSMIAANIGKNKVDFMASRKKVRQTGRLSKPGRRSRLRPKYSRRFQGAASRPNWTQATEWLRVRGIGGHRVHYAGFRRRGARQDFDAVVEIPPPIPFALTAVSRVPAHDLRRIPRGNRRFPL